MRNINEVMNRVLDAMPDTYPKKSEIKISLDRIGTMLSDFSSPEMAREQWREFTAVIQSNLKDCEETFVENVANIMAGKI